MNATIQPELIPATDQHWKPKEDALAPVTPLSLMQIALERGQVEQLQILQDMHFKQMARDAEMEFTQAMNAAQAELGRIAPDLTNPETHSKYASYPALDRKIRPVYIKHGFSLSFDSEDGAQVDTVKTICYVSHRAGHTRKYQSPSISSDGKGPKGGAVMTKTHATGAAMSYGARYLLKYIFNIAVGEEDTDGNAGPQMDQDELSERIAHFPKCETFEELEQHFRASYMEAKKAKDQGAIDAVVMAKNKQKEALRKAGAK